MRLYYSMTYSIRKIFNHFSSKLEISVYVYLFPNRKSYTLMQLFLRPTCNTIKGLYDLFVVINDVNSLVKFFLKYRQMFLLHEQLLKDIFQSLVSLLFLDCMYPSINQNLFSFIFSDQFLIKLYYTVCDIVIFIQLFFLRSVLERLFVINN